MVGDLCERLRLMFFGNLRQDWSEFVLADLGVFKYVIALAMAGVSILMMSRVVYPSFKHINMRTRGTMYAIVFIVLAVICIFKFPWVMPAVIFSIYLLYGLVRPWVARRWRNRLEARDGE